MPLEDENDESENDEDEDEDFDEEEELEDNVLAEKERLDTTKSISVAVSGVDVVKDEWLAVAYDRDWFPGQFVQFDKEQEEMQIHFLHRSSSNRNWFIWPELSNDLPDVSWVPERMYEGNSLIMFFLPQNCIIITY